MISYFRNVTSIISFIHSFIIIKKLKNQENENDTVNDFFLVFIAILTKITKNKG